MLLHTFKIAMHRSIFSLLLFSVVLPCEAQFFTLRPAVRQSFRVMSKSEVDSHRGRTEGERVSKADHTDEIKQDSILPSPLQGFSSPLDRALVINSGFGLRTDPFTNKSKFHYGVDLHSRSDAVLSMLGGRVKKTGYDKRGYGNFVTMIYGDFEVTYAHLSSILVSSKDVVTPGAPIGISGSTGRATGEHLHISVKFRGKPVDPIPFLLFIEKRARKDESNITT